MAWVTTLGPLAFGRDPSGAEAAVRSPIQRVLAALLLVDVGTEVPSSELAEAVWAGAVPANARRALAPHVTRLRRALEAATGDRVRITGGRTGYRLDAAPDVVDHERFRSLVASSEDRSRSAADRYRAGMAALELWHAEPLRGMEHPSIVTWRSLLRERRAAAGRSVADAAHELGADAEVVPALVSVCEDAPLDESLAAKLMRALLSTGRRGEALLRYESTRGALREELGCSPSGGLVEMLRAATETTVSEPLSPPRLAAPQRVDPIGGRCDLPADDEFFTGRALLADRVIGSVHAEGTSSCRLFTGPPGIGKTALAIHIAHRLSETFPDAQLYLEDASGKATDRRICDVLLVLLARLGVRPEATDDQAELRAAWRNATSGRSVVLVLDDVEDAALLSAVRPASSSIVLATGRHPVFDEDAPMWIQVPPLAAPCARDLVVELAASCGRQLDDEEVERVVQATHGVPRRIRESVHEVDDS